MEEMNQLEADIYNSLRTVEDPELHIPIVDLGLIYDVKADAEGKALIKMTLTSMGCPAGPYLKAETISAALKVNGVTDADVEIVWTPKWDPRLMASEDAKEMLGIYD
ncbi:MAG TPA: iron-sulfur cluster assembly protein [Leptospiraceae bacterium]|nr:iron-sulfur cluster assembly protein [Leptospiraceae bacterium]HMY68090.1 iron-sulfur cluster assembly protein [Leptospiraceae bacterium]HNF13260.1 iron-sulfur cluster assembly protein [Leptospiraceae bacterium]HNF25507.1 iron-sulfur cluster assembly protein [Leptospiraceae bacterium]HNH09161.1 iron-sulfur cluster assembly protein [Leptospiraceae bacterium]